MAESVSAQIILKVYTRVRKDCNPQSALRITFCAALHAFLEAALEQKIQDVVLTANDAPAGYDRQRGVNYDIMVTLDSGRCVNVEMQAYNREYDYGKRAEYHVSRLETTYLRKGDGWEKAPAVYQITVMDFAYDKQDSNVVGRYAMRKRNGHELAGLLNIIFIELPKIAAKERDISKNTALENWALFFKYVDNPRKRDIIQRITEKEAGLMAAQEALTTISTDRDLWIWQMRQEDFERDRISGLTAAEQKGLKRGREEGLSEGLKQGLSEGRKQGREQGRSEGREEGISQTKLENARNLLAMNVLTHEQIAQAVGLSVEKIDELAGIR